MKFILLFLCVVVSSTSYGKGERQKDFKTTEKIYLKQIKASETRKVAVGKLSALYLAHHLERKAYTLRYENASDETEKAKIYKQIKNLETECSDSFASFVHSWAYQDRVDLARVLSTGRDSSRVLSTSNYLASLGIVVIRAYSFEVRVMEDDGRHFKTNIIANASI